jgi:competence protein ComEC
MQLDVGQGDSALVLGDSAGLVDAGSARAAREAGWLSMLSRNGVAALDWVVLTHLDEDHAGGLKKLMPWVPIRCIVVPPAAWSERRGLELRRQAAIWGIRTQPRAQGCFPHRWAALSRRSKAPNAGMAGVVVPLGSGGIYLNLGDAGSRAPSREQELASLLLGKDLSRPGPVLFKLSHHGSRHSSDPSWLKRLAPREVWISAALANPHGHPHPEVLERLRQTQIPWRGTWLHGALISN